MENRSHIAQLVSLVIFCMAFAGQPAFSQSASTACDSDLHPLPNHPQGYMERGEGLCEGIYATGVSSMGLSLAALTGPMTGVNFEQSGTYNLRWKTANSSEVRIRAESLRPRLYYRMDAVFSASETGMVWNNAIPALNQLRTREIGIWAMQMDASGKKIFLPLTISPEGQGQPVTPYLATVVSGADIDEIYWSLDRGTQSLVYDEALEHGPYMARQPVTIEFAGVNEPGIYHVTITAVLRNNATISIEFDFLHAL